MTKNLKIGFLVSMVLFSLLLTSFASVGCAQEETIQDKGLTILNDVIGFDLSKYDDTTVKNYSPESYLDVLSSEKVRYKIESSDSNLDVQYTFVTNKLQRIHVLEADGSVHMNRVAIDSFEMAKDFLESYEDYTKNSFYGNLRLTLTKFDMNKNSTLVSGNTKLKVSAAEDSTTFRWTYIHNGIEAPDKCVALRYKNGVLKYFIDNWDIYTIGNKKFNLSEKDAINLAMERTKTSSMQSKTEEGTFELKFNVTNAMIWETIYAPSTYVDIPHGENLLELYPLYHVWVSLDKFYPGNIYGFNVYIWADTGELCYLKERVTTMDPPTELVATFDDATKISDNKTTDTGIQSNSISSTGIIIPLLSTIFLISVPLYLHKKKTITLPSKLLKFWSSRVSGLLFSLMLISSTLILALPVSVVNADNNDSKFMVWGSESNGSFNETIVYIGPNGNINGSSWRKTIAEVLQQQETAQIITDLFANNGYNATNSQGENGTTSHASAILNETAYNTLNFDRVAVVDFDHGNGRNDIPDLEGEFHYMFEDQNGTLEGKVYQWQDVTFENAVFDMNISQRTILGNNTFFTFINACNSAHVNSTYHTTGWDSTQGIVNPDDPPSQWRARGLPYAWTHHKVTNEPDSTPDVGWMSSDGYTCSDDGEFCFMGFVNGSAALNQTINGTGNSYHEWLESFFNFSLTDDFTINQALDEASESFYGYDCDFDETTLGNRSLKFTSIWPMYQNGEWSDPSGPGYLAVYGNGNLVLYQPCLNISGVYGGYTNPAAGEHYYGYGSNVSVTATSNVTGAYFLYWLLDGNPSGNNNPINITMTEDHTLEPVFYTPPISYSLYYSAVDNLPSAVAADVYLDGEYQGHFSSQVFYVSPGPHTIQVSNPNGFSFQKFIDSSNQTTYTNPTTVNVWSDYTWIQANFIRTLTQSTILAEDVADGSATSYPLQRKTFYGNGRFWAFFVDDETLKYASSVDGTTWTNPTTFSSVRNGYYASLCFDGTHVHVAYIVRSGLSTPPPDLRYQRGTPNPNGTITWSPSRLISRQQSVYYLYPTIAVDSEGYPWIGYHQVNYPNSYLPFVIKSSTNDGTWSTANGFPYQLTSGPYDHFSVSLVPLTSGKMLALYGGNSDSIYARRWDGSSWGSQVATTSTNYVGNLLSAVGQGDDVQLVCYRSGTVVNLKYSYASNSFGSETILQSSVSSTCYPVIAKTDSADLYAFWGENSHIYYKKYTNATGLWDVNPTDWISDPYMWSYYGTLTCSYQNELGKISVVYMSSCPEQLNNVMFNYLNVPITTFSVYNLTIVDVPGGTTNPLPDTYTYMPDVNVSVTATPNLGFVLDYWLLDDINIGNNLTITVNMNSSHTLEPVFTALGIGRAQGNIKATATGLTSQIPVTLDYTPTEGNVLVAVVGARTQGYPVQSVSNITQTGVTWTRQVNGSYYSTASEIWLGIVGAGASKTLTVNLQNTIGINVWSVADVCEYAGIATTNYLDQTAKQQGNSGYYQYTGTTNPTTQADELWIGCIVTLSNYDQSSPSNGFTMLDGIAIDNFPLGVGYFEKIVSSIGQAGTSVINEECSYYGCIATFKAAP